MTLATVLAVGAIAAAVVVPNVHARGSAAPSNIELPSLVVVPAVGSYLTATPGSWSGSPTSFSYQWLFCPGGGGAQDGSGCTVSTTPSSTPGQVLVEKADVGSSFRVRVTATGAEASATAVSDASPAAMEPDLSFITGCPPADATGPLLVDKVVPPARLDIDRNTSTPAVIMRSTQRLTLRFHVVACGGRNVQGALVYATPTPFQQFIGPERKTDASGWVTIPMTRQRFFPATPQQQNLVVFVRARKVAEDLLGGISTRRLVSFRVRLR